jgi:hypothetical protein
MGSFWELNQTEMGLTSQAGQTSQSHPKCNLFISKCIKGEEKKSIFLGLI